MAAIGTQSAVDVVDQEARGVAPRGAKRIRTLPMDTPRDMDRYTQSVIRRVEKGVITPDAGKALGYLAQVNIKAKELMLKEREQVVYENRLAAAELKLGHVVIDQP
jgi:hypothetical protein